MPLGTGSCGALGWTAAFSARVTLAFKPEQAETQAMGVVTDLVTPKEVAHIEITQR